MTFIALDFEIANNNYNSACSIGLVFVNDNEIIDKKYYLIQPPGNKFDPAMTKIHGLTPEDVKEAPTFDLLWNNISDYFNNDTYVIAHNARFDMSVLKSCLITYDLEIPDFNYACSIPISTRACRGEGIANSLKARTERFGIEMDNHHNALSDAKAVAELVITCIKLQRRRTIHSYFRTYSSIAIRSFVELEHDTVFRRGGFNFENVRISDIKPETDEFDENHPLFNKNVAFTGVLDTIHRAEAMQSVVNLGGGLRSGAGQTTDILVVGRQNKRIVGETGKSSKERKAEQLNKEGFDIKIINEDEFISLINYRK